MVEYITTVIVPYINENRRQLGLDPKHTGLVILDEFKGHTTERHPNNFLKQSLTTAMATKLLCRRIWERKLSLWTCG